MPVRSLYRFVCLAACLGGLAACSHGSKASNKDLVAANDAERFAYGIGYNLGNETRLGLADDGMTADVATIKRGFADGLHGSKPAIPKREIDAVLRAVHRTLLDRASQRRYAEDPEFRAVADQNLVASEAAIKAFAAAPGARQFADGVYIQTIATGAGPKPGEGEIYVADWTLELADGTVVDERKGQHLDHENVLPAAAKVLATMRVGDHWKVAFAPAQAFGLGGNAPAVGPNVAIVVDVTIVGTAKRPQE